MKPVRLAIAVFLLSLGLTGLVSAQDKSLPYYQAGNTYYSQKNYDMAIRYYQAAVQMNPNFWQAYQGLGNSYYAKGDNANALTNYDKALSLNPNNPQLSTFDQNLHTQAGTAPALPATTNPGTTATTNPTPKGAAKNLELELGAGVGLASSAAAQGYSTDFGMGFGGRARGLYLIDPDFGVGGTLGYYTFSKTYPGSTASFNYSFIDIAATGKYKFEGGNIKPYVVAGLGISSVSFSLSSGSSSSPSASQTGPLIQIGGGVEIPAGADMAFFGELKYEMVLISSSGTSLTFSYIPFEAGVAFNL